MCRCQRTASSTACGARSGAGADADACIEAAGIPLTAVGTWFYHFGEYPDILAQARAGLRVADLVTHRFPPAGADAAFQAMADGRSSKVLLAYSTARLSSDSADSRSC